MKGAELARRRKFDYEILRDMRCPSFDFEAYRTGGDLERRANRVTDAQAGSAGRYRLKLRIPTLIGPGKWAQETIIGVNVDVADYPRAEPATWVISHPVPWSPHFRAGSPVCIGEEFWQAREGHVTLGHLVVHIARMLNWDEKGRGGGYVGWNAKAIEYHQTHYGGRPLDSALVYPVLPSWLYGEPDDDQPFEIITHQRPR
ncbi:hypothetical protein [Sphaerisporangium corydalis]|uniref:UBC core domain-containing protein n=1 Tax=Sphaerisporangium corydalis TaxID=1441875 RepID=A0ABV9EJZ1_9ACTN|nr:hypothetical protein [Sphaerisporangium corydalis]